MQFRIPQNLDGFETAAHEAGLVSQEALAAAKTRADPNLSWSFSLRAGQGDASWTEERCLQLYCFLHHIDGQHGLKASQLKLVTDVLSSAGLCAAEPKIDEALSSSRHGTDLSLSIFFTCQMLQRVEQWLLRQDSLKASKGGKQSNAEVVKVWLELKSRALQDLVAWQDAVVAQDMLPSAADIRSACKLIWCTALDVANSNWHGQRGKGSKALQESVDAALTEILARPFLMSSSNEPAAADALTDLLRVCLGKKQSHLQVLLANIIGTVATSTASAAATAETTAAGALSEAALGAAAEAPDTAAAKAPNAAASEAAVSMLDAVADRLSPRLGGNLHLTGRKQQQNKATTRNTKMDLVQQQESAAQVMLAYASRGEDEQQMVLQLYFSKIAACMVASDSVTLRKLALEFASAQLTSQPHIGALYNLAMHLVKAGTKDKDATVRVKALGIVGCVAAEAALSDTSQEESIIMLTQRLLDTSVMVRRAAVQAAQQLLQAAAQTDTQQHRPPWCWPVYIKLAEALCSLLTAVPDSPLASHGLQQDAFNLLMKFPAAAHARPSSGGCSGQLLTAAGGTGLPSGLPSESTGLPFQHTTQGRQLPSEHPSVDTGLPCDRLCGDSQLPSKHRIEGTGLPSEHPCKGTGLPSEHPCEISQLPFVNWLLSLHMDKVQQGQLLQAWLSAGGAPVFGSWQMFLGQCDHAQTQQVSEAMKAAGKGGCCAGITMQCYQQLHTMLEDVDTGTATETPAMLTVDQAATTAATLKVLCVMGATTLKPQDLYGEAALLLDTIDLVLHSAAVASSTTAAAAAAAAPAAAAITTMCDSDQMILDDPSSSYADQQQQPACPRGDSNDKPSSARQPVSQTEEYGKSVLWGLRAIAAMAKQDGLAQHCAHMLIEYVLERVVLLSRDWPVKVGQAAAAVLRSLPCFQQTSTKALKLLETEVQSDMTHLTVANQTEQSSSWQRLTVNFLLLLGRMADNYLLERDAFLQKLAISHRVEGESDSGAVVHRPESPVLEPPNKRHRPEEEESESAEVTLQAQEGFDYMKAGNDRSHAQALAQEYMTRLVHESAPASSLPMLASLVQAPLLPMALKVAAMRSLGRLAVLTEELTLQYSPIILKALSCMQQANACQPDSRALPHTEAPSQADVHARSHQVPTLERGANAAAEVEAEAAAVVEPHAEAMMEGTTAAAAEPGAEALMEGTVARSPTDAVWPVTDQMTGHKKKGSPASEMAPECVLTEQDGGKSSAYSQASTAKQDAYAVCTPMSSLGTAAAAIITTSSIQNASGGSPIPLAPIAAAAAAAAAMIHPRVSASEQAQAVGTVTAATDSAASAGAKAVAPEAEAVVLEAVSAAAAMVEAFPHLLDDLGEALASKLRCAIGSSGGRRGPVRRRALAVAVASLVVQEKCKCRRPMGLIGEAIMCQDLQVSALMKHVLQQLRRNKPLQRHKLLLDMFTQAPLHIKPSLAQVLVTDIMTPQDLRAEGMVGPALQACLAKLAADTEAEDLVAATGLQQHLVPSRKHLTALQHYLQEHQQTLQQCSDDTLDQLTKFVSNSGATGALPEASENVVRAEAGTRRNAKAVQQALLASLQACRRHMPLHQERRAKRKTVREQEAPIPEGSSKEELLQYQKAVSKIKETSHKPNISRITDLFKES